MSCWVRLHSKSCPLVSLNLLHEINYLVDVLVGLDLSLQTIDCVDQSMLEHSSAEQPDELLVAQFPWVLRIPS